MTRLIHLPRGDLDFPKRSDTLTECGIIGPTMLVNTMTDKYLAHPFHCKRCAQAREYLNGRNQTKDLARTGPSARATEPANPAGIGGQGQPEAPPGQREAQDGIRGSVDLQ